MIVETLPNRCPNCYRPALALIHCNDGRWACGSCAGDQRLRHESKNTIHVCDDFMGRILGDYIVFEMKGN